MGCYASTDPVEGSSRLVGHRQGFVGFVSAVVADLAPPVLRGVYQGAYNVAWAVSSIRLGGA